MSEQEKDQAPVTAAGSTPSSAAATADVAIAESGANGSAVPAVQVGRPPVAKILGGIAAVIVVAMLWIIAGNVKLQACVSQAEAQYGSNTDPKSLATLGRKNAVLRCTNSPF